MSREIQRPQISKQNKWCFASAKISKSQLRFNYTTICPGVQLWSSASLYLKKLLKRYICMMTHNANVKCAFIKWSLKLFICKETQYDSQNVLPKCFACLSQQSNEDRCHNNTLKIHVSLQFHSPLQYSPSGP